MLSHVLIRQANPDEYDSVQTLVQTVADETFAYLFAPSPVPIGEKDWSQAWLAVSEKKILGVVLTHGEWISDLWVPREIQGKGIGRKLLAHGESQIIGRGHRASRLRVVKSNTRAVQFYLRHGWQVAREFPHEKFNHAMFEMVKSSQTSVPTTIATDRLILRPFDSNDVEAAFEWFGDPVVMRFTPSGPDKSVNDTKKRVDKYQEHQIEHGFSKWVVVDRETGHAIGDAGLLVLQDYNWIDFGYRLAQPYWGKGLATEAATGWVLAAFDQFHIDLLTAFVHPENVASIRVLDKLGFHAHRQETVMGMKSILYSLPHSSYRS